MEVQRFDEVDGPPLTVAAVAHRLGIAPATLRTWDRRYGLGPQEHTLGAHRRYTPADVARLQTMRRLTLEGVPPGDAAQVALRALLVEAPATLRASPNGSGPGGRVLAVPGSSDAVRGLGRAAMALDTAEVTRLLRRQVDANGVLHTWDHILRPVLVAVGARWAVTGEGIEVEHLLSDCAAAVLRRESDVASPVPGRRPVLLACAPDEQHALPLFALGAGLAERGIATRTLGPAMPAPALRAAVRRTGPAALFIWSQLPKTADPAVLSSFPVTRPPTALLVGGPGWNSVELPDEVAMAQDLPHAVALVEHALGA